jgi:hypothetical protein
VQKREIFVRPQMTQIEVQEMLGEWAKKSLAEVRPMGRLVRPYRTEGESLHWHIAGQRKGMGTVEVTYLPSTGKLTVLVHDNRRGVWAGRAYEDLADEIEKHKTV